MWLLSLGGQGCARRGVRPESVPGPHRLQGCVSDTLTHTYTLMHTHTYILTHSHTHTEFWVGEGTAGPPVEPPPLAHSGTQQPLSRCVQLGGGHSHGGPERPGRGLHSQLPPRLLSPLDVSPNCPARPRLPPSWEPLPWCGRFLTHFARPTQHRGGGSAIRPSPRGCGTPPRVGEQWEGSWGTRTPGRAEAPCAPAQNHRQRPQTRQAEGLTATTEQQLPERRRGPGDRAWQAPGRVSAARPGHLGRGPVLFFWSCSPGGRGGTRWGLGQLTPSSQAGPAVWGLLGPPVRSRGTRAPVLWTWGHCWAGESQGCVQPQRGPSGNASWCLAFQEAPRAPGPHPRCRGSLAA